MATFSLRALLVPLAVAVPTTAFAAIAVDRPGEPHAVPGYVRGAADAIRWSPPSPDHPLGTALVSYAHERGVRLVEWDFARHAAVRASLIGGAPGRGHDTSVAARGHRAVVIFGGETRDEPVSLVFASSSLGIERSRTIADGRHPVVATHGDAITAAWISGANHLAVARFGDDARETARITVTLAERPLPYDRACELAIAGNRVWISVQGERDLHVVSTTLDLEDVRQLHLPSARGSVAADGETPRLVVARGGRLESVALDRDGEAAPVLPLGADVTGTREVAAFDDEHRLALGDGRVFDARGDRGLTMTPLPVHRVVWVNGVVLRLESGLEKPSLAISWIAP